MDQLLSLHRGLLLGCMLLSGSVVFAQAPTQAPPPLFMRDGRISTVNLTEDMITVNDLLYYLSYRLYRRRGGRGKTWGTHGSLDPPPREHA